MWFLKICFKLFYCTHLFQSRFVFSPQELSHTQYRLKKVTAAYNGVCTHCVASPLLLFTTYIITAFLHLPTSDISLICVTFKNKFTTFFFFIRTMEMWSNNRQKINHLRRPWSHPDPQRRYSTFSQGQCKTIVLLFSVFMLKWTWVWSFSGFHVSFLFHMSFFIVPCGAFCVCRNWTPQPDTANVGRAHRPRSQRYKRSKVPSSSSLLFINSQIKTFLFLSRIPKKLSNLKLLRFPKMMQTSNRYLNCTQ